MADIIAPFGATVRRDLVSLHAYSLKKKDERCFYTLGRFWCAGAKWAASTDQVTQIYFLSVTLNFSVTVSGTGL
jgi:hypothetical protein